jgi:hypothetical protein
MSGGELASRACLLGQYSTVEHLLIKIVNISLKSSLSKLVSTRRSTALILTFQ